MLRGGEDTKQLVEIVLTGGSCAGKTTALSLLSGALRERGHHVLTVPEAVTMLATSGIPDLGEISRRHLERGCRFQREVFRVQRTLRSSHRELAELFPGSPVVILYDRGELDGLAYHRHHCIGGYAEDEGTTLDAIRDSYAAVMHLVTAADGAEAAYIQAANPARWDTPAEARASDRLIHDAWSGNPRHVVIDNSTDFIGKMERLIDACLEVIPGAGELRGRRAWKQAATAQA
jgi:hypothetical protein